MIMATLALLLLIVHSCFAQNIPEQPKKIALSWTTSKPIPCEPQEVDKETVEETIESFILEEIFDITPSRSKREADAAAARQEQPAGQGQCECGGIGWTNVVNLELNGTQQKCPQPWSNYNSPSFSGCRKTIVPCQSMHFLTGLAYSHVCGQINAIQLGTMDAFSATTESLEDAYLDGISLTRGTPGQREHIWSFVAAPHDQWQGQIPEFVGRDYFCDSAKDLNNPLPEDVIFTDNPLWDGQGCHENLVCCANSSPPWFRKELSQSNSETLEMRVCLDGSPSSKDLVITLIDLYVK